MKNLILSFFFGLIAIFTYSQQQKGTIVVERINAPSLQNSAGEDPVRRVTIYLPPGYKESTKRYPVIYFLHGFWWSDSLMIAQDHFDQVLDKAIQSGKIKPVILVMPNENNQYRGSFYTNSSLTGNWADFTAKELVSYIDTHYRTIASKNSRGVSGHSMGGHGAIKMGMLFPEVFSCVYALSPAVLALGLENGPYSNAFKNLAKYKTSEQLLNSNEFMPIASIAMGRAYSPNPDKPPFYCDLPFSYKGDSIIVDYKTLELWENNSPLYMAGKYAANLRKLKAIKFDWGRNDEFQHIPSTCHMFSLRLESLAIPHYAEEYIGSHGSKIMTEDGRVLNEMLPFFDKWLEFAETIKP